MPRGTRLGTTARWLTMTATCGRILQFILNFEQLKLPGFSAEFKESLHRGVVVAARLWRISLKASQLKRKMFGKNELRMVLRLSIDILSSTVLIITSFFFDSANQHLLVNIHFVCIYKWELWERLDFVEADQRRGTPFLIMQIQTNKKNQ